MPVPNCLTLADKQNINNFIHTHIATSCLVFLQNIVSFTLRTIFKFQTIDHLSTDVTFILFNIEKSYTRYINIKTQKNTHTQ